MLDYYIIEDHVDKVIKVIEEIQNDAYYVQMAKAWILAEIGIKFNDKAMKYLQSSNNLNKFTYNKTLQKMIESYRISEEQKILLKKMKRKN
jgi:3-methyladenine DNA glycosylase AlkD